MTINYLAQRHIRKAARELLRHAGYVRQMREDVESVRNMERLKAAEADIRAGLRGGDLTQIEPKLRKLESCIAGVTPAVRYPAIREHVEIVAVALAVAMGCRAYLVQPFKIPTGSMEPTLSGIHFIPRAEPAFTDRMPLKLAKWLILGEWYLSIKATSDGTMGPVQRFEKDPVHDYYSVGNKLYKLPRNTTLSHSPGDFVAQGTLLWAGVKKSGDHVFVNKVSWNFRRPRRNEVMVFRTDGISRLTQHRHFIKRMIGLPGETISIRTPRVFVNGRLIDDGMIGAIGRCEPGYAGYRPEDGKTEKEYNIPAEHYFAMGDNTRQSHDSRFWGPVPKENLVGPGWVVYWPFSANWGFVR